jgi:hypothetical protein
MTREHEEIMAELRNDCEDKRKMLQEDWESLVSKKRKKSMRNSVE